MFKVAKSSRRNYETGNNIGSRAVSLMSDVNIPFPVDEFPAVLRDYICEAADAIGCDPSYIAIPLLASVARVICNKRSIRVKADWIEPAVIWGAIIGASGDYKTPAQRAATYFLVAAQKSLNPGTDQVTFCSADTSFPALRDILKAQPDGSLLLMPDELVEVFHSLGSRGQSALKKGHWLSFWSATGLTVHRYKQEVTIPRAAVGIVGGIQPGTFRDEVRKERHITDGFCARFLLTWQSQLKPAKWSDKKISFDTRWELSDVFDKLLEMPCDFDEEFYQPVPIPLNDGARYEFMRFYNRHNGESFRLDHDLKAAWKKLEAYTARFALIFQMVTWASKAPCDKAGKHIKVSTINMQRAIKLTEWFKNEAKRIYALLNETPDDTRRRELVDLIRRNGNIITANKLRQRNKAYGSEHSATSALNDLVKHKLATKELIKPGAKGGRPTTQYKIN